MGINIQNVTYNYDNNKKLAINELNLNVNSIDEFIFLVGKTGSGKSTLLQLMNTLILPKQGNIYIKDRNIVEKYKNKKVFNNETNRIKYHVTGKGPFLKVQNPIYNKRLKDLRGYVGLVFQFPEYQLFESSVIKDVMFGPRNFGKNETDARKNAIMALKQVGFPEELYEESPFNLSGGQMRKVALAGILAMDPNILMLDEPTVGLDPASKEDLMNTLVTLNTKYHKSIIIVSHDMNLVSEYAKRVIVMHNGVKEFDGSPAKLFDSKELLNSLTLDFSYASRIAIELKEKGLLNYNKLPLTFDQLEKAILGEDYE